MPGMLSIVATPIGNLEDVTYRAIRTLRECDVIAAEDTRRTARLLARYEIRKPLVSLRQQNEAREGVRLVDRVLAGQHVVYVTDAGTPGIADPGARLVRLARDRGARVQPVPGPSAVATVLSVSGLEADQFAFLGFPPSSGRARAAWIDSAVTEHRTVVFFEAPHRIVRTVVELTELVKRPIMVWRELTKVHEELVVCTNKADSARIRPEGEFTVVLPGQSVGLSADSAEGILSGRREAALTAFEALCSGNRTRQAAFETIGALMGLPEAKVKRFIKNNLYIG